MVSSIITRRKVTQCPLFQASKPGREKECSLQFDLLLCVRVTVPLVQA